MTTAKAIGLSGYGNQAVVNCANYNMSSGDPTQAQTCAAVNFLSNQCLSPTTKQGAIIAANAATVLPNATDCTGTYGQAQSSYGYAEAESSSDAIFSNVTNLASTAPAAASETCSVQTVVTTPAQYAINTCSKNDSSNEVTCYQYLNTSIQTTYTTPTTTDSCTAPAVLEGAYCVSQTSSPAPVVYGCPPGQTLQGQTCVSTSSSAATPVYSCPTGFTLNGTTCSETSTAAPIPSQTCPTVVGASNSYPKGYNPGTIDNVTGYCQYTFGENDQLTAMAACQKKFPQALDGSTLFFAKNFLAVTGKDQKFLTCYLTTESACPAGYTLNGSVCQELVTQNATITGYSCPTGVLSGNQCVVTVSNPADPSYQCPTGTQLSGSDCVSTTQNPPNVSYSCPNGQSPQQGECITNYVLTSWVDTCALYETSAGAPLPTPP